MKKSLLVYVLLLCVSILSLTACTEKEDRTPTFPVYETQDVSQFEISVDIPISSEISTEATVKNSKSSLSNMESDDRISQADLDIITDGLYTENAENIESSSSENTEPSNTENIENTENIGISSSDLPDELKEILNQQNQKAVDEGLEIIKRNLNN